MKVTIEIDSKSELEKLSALLKSLHITKINVLSSTDKDTISIRKGNKKINPKGLFGIWADKPKSLESIRKDAWQIPAIADLTNNLYISSIKKASLWQRRDR